MSQLPNLLFYQRWQRFLFSQFQQHTNSRGYLSASNLVFSDQLDSVQTPLDSEAKDLNTEYQFFSFFSHQVKIRLEQTLTRFPLAEFEAVSVIAVRSWQQYLSNNQAVPAVIEPELECNLFDSWEIKEPEISSDSAESLQAEQAALASSPTKPTACQEILAKDASINPDSNKDLLQDRGFNNPAPQSLVTLSFAEYFAELVTEIQQQLMAVARIPARVESKDSAALPDSLLNSIASSNQEAISLVFICLPESEQRLDLKQKSRLDQQIFGVRAGNLLSVAESDLLLTTESRSYFAFAQFLQNFLLGRTQSQLELLAKQVGFNRAAPHWLLVSKEVESISTSLLPQLGAESGYFVELEQVNFLPPQQQISYLLNCVVSNQVASLLPDAALRSCESKVPQLQIFSSLASVEELRELTDLVSEFYLYSNLNFEGLAEATEISLFPELPALQLVVVAEADYLWKFLLKMLRDHSADAEASADRDLVSLVEEIFSLLALLEALLKSFSSGIDLASEAGVDLSPFSPSNPDPNLGLGSNLLKTANPQFNLVAEDSRISAVAVEKLSQLLQLLESLLLKLEALATTGSRTTTITANSLLTWLLNHSSYSLWLASQEH